MVLSRLLHERLNMLALSRLVNFLKSQDLLDASRLESRFFTRCGALPFATVLAFLLCGVRGTVQAERDSFLVLLHECTRLVRVVSAQAFAKARHQIRADVLERINRALLTLVAEQIGFPRWCGLRLVAADATPIRLTRFDPKRRVRFIQEAVAFGLFLPGLELFERFTLYERRPLPSSSPARQTPQVPCLQAGGMTQS